jgi:phosphate transport system substrate-binding protein
MKFAGGCHETVIEESSNAHAANRLSAASHTAMEDAAMKRTTPSAVRSDRPGRAWNLATVTRAALIGGAVALMASAAWATEISGAGATFPYPIYAKWAEAYQKQTGKQLNYQSIGSGGGIRQIKSKTVTFGASDKPLEPAELKASGLVQFPMIMGGVVPVVNVEGIKAGALKLDGKTLADIFMGEIASWNDDRIAKLNPGVKLPDQAIAVVHRSDGSGTTFLFTNYLTKVSSNWKEQVGSDASVQWPVGIGAKGNEGVANNVARTGGAIGYVEYAYALQNNLPYVLLINKAGKAVSPTSEAFQAAASHADWAHSDRFYVILTDQPGDESWPITGASFILMYEQPDNPQASLEALKFFAWSYAKGDAMAEQLHYVPMPDPVVKLVEQMWEKSIKGAGGKAVWTEASVQ